MEVQRRTQAERSASTRAALLAAARPLFAQRGYADVGTPEIAAAAGMTRGALYHQFTDKLSLFTAVLEQLEEELVGQLAEQVAAAAPPDALAALSAALDGWLDACRDPALVRIALVDAPTVLGQHAWREIATRYGLGLAVRLLQEAIEVGLIHQQPVEPLAHVLLGAADEAALYVAYAADPDHARDQVKAVLHQLVNGLRTGLDPLPGPLR
jgi:AcrR family transcriptional regulator